MTHYTGCMRRARTSWWKPVAAWAVAAACLVWVLHGIDMRRLAGEVRGLRWELVALAVGSQVLSYVVQGWRWQLLLRPVGGVPVSRTTQAIYAGLFANEVLPLRFGEMVRAWLVARWVRVKLLAILPSVFVERLFDGIWLAVGIGLTAIAIPLPPALDRAADTLGEAVLVVTALFAVFVFVKRPSRPKERRRSKLAGWSDSIAAGLWAIGRSPSFYGALGVSLLFLVLQGLAFWCVMLAYGIGLSFWAGAVVFLVVRLGTAIPNAPANVGTFQFFTVVGLLLFRVHKTEATGFSLVAFMVITLPLLALGFLALSHSGTTLWAIREQVFSPGEAAPESPAPGA
jgi:glycosyltransferase 2 family protein